MSAPGTGFSIVNFRLPIVSLRRPAGRRKNRGELFCFTNEVAHPFAGHHLRLNQKLEPEYTLIDLFFHNAQLRNEIRAGSRLADGSIVCSNRGS
jgi:hypothetical protein